MFSDVGGVRAQLDRAGTNGDVQGRQILGLYTGGTLAYETSHLLQAAFGAGHPHRILDLGDDQYTVGRPHPMIDPGVRTDKIIEAASDPQVRLLLLDLVLGTGAHGDPAEPLASAVHQARRIAAKDGRRLGALASIVGTAGDPQDLGAQRLRLQEAGIAVLASNSDATRCAAMLVKPALRNQWMNTGA